MLGVAGWVLAAVAGFVLALAASRRVADNATALVQATTLSPFVVGLVLLAVGTDIPEIANSLITSASGHGDLNVGDSIGSALTQMTLVLGLFPFLGGITELEPRATLAIGGLTSAAILFGVVLLGDGTFSRVDGGLLVASWVVTMVLVNRSHLLDMSAPQPVVAGPRVRHGLAIIAYLGIVALGAAIAVNGMIEIAQRLGIPEYAVSFFGAAIGTSLPELIVDVTAIKRGAAALAIGDVLGSSLVDATLSVGIGPLLFPTFVDAGLVVQGGLFAATAIALTVIVLAVVRRHTRVSGGILLAIYALAYLVLLR